MYVGSNSIRKRERRFCKQCGKPYIWLLSNPSDYCSKKCKILANQTTNEENNKPEEGKQQYRADQNSKKIQYSQCAYCGKTYDLSVKTAHRKYCSTLCRVLAVDKVERIEREWRKCKYCQQEFECPSLSERKFCSEKCEKTMFNEMMMMKIKKDDESIVKPMREKHSIYSIYNINKGYSQCEYCGKIYDLSKGEHYNKFCSAGCKLLAMDPEDSIKYESRICEYCGKTFQCPHFADRKYCSEKCEEAINSKSVLRDNSGEKESYRCNDVISKEKKEIPKKKHSYNETEIRICKNCGQSFTWFPAKPYDYFCSEKCKRESDESKKLQKEHLDNPADEALYEFVEEKVTYLVKRLLCCGESYNGRCIDYWKIGTISEKTREQVLDRDKYECQVCGRTDHLHIHHIIKRRNGGNHDPENLITLCASCHRHIETGDVSHAVKKCFDNAKLHYNMEQKSLSSYAGSVKGDLEEIFSDIEKMNKQEFQEILIDLDEIIERL